MKQKQLNFFDTLSDDVHEIYFLKFIFREQIFIKKKNNMTWFLGLLKRAAFEFEFKISMKENINHKKITVINLCFRTLKNNWFISFYWFFKVKISVWKHTYACIYTYIYLFIYSFIYLYICIYIYIFILVCICIFLYI